MTEDIDFASTTSGDMLAAVRLAAASADKYARAWIDGIHEVLQAFPSHTRTAALCDAFEADLQTLRKFAPCDGSFIGWAIALVEAAVHGGPIVDTWNGLLEFGAAFVTVSAIAQVEGETRLPLQLPPGGSSLHGIGERLIPDRSGSVTDGRRRFRRERLFQIPIAGGSITVDSCHQFVRDHMLTVATFPHGNVAQASDLFPFKDSLHGSDIGALSDGAAMVADTWIDGAAMVERFGRSFMPVASPDAHTNLSVSSERFPGWIVASLDTPLYMAECLIHEASHNLLYEAARDRPLIRPDGTSLARWYSPWRPDARPLGGLLHACFVFNNVMTLYGRLATSQRLPEHSNTARRRLGAELRRVGIALEVLGQSNELTVSGQHMVAALARRADEWSGSDLAVLTQTDEEEIKNHHATWSANYRTLSRYVAR